MAATTIDVLRGDHVANGVSESILSIGLEDTPTSGSDEINSGGLNVQTYNTFSTTDSGRAHFSPLGDRRTRACRAMRAC